MLQQYVYAMLNRRNGLVKIGRSQDPVYREKTLASEEPEVVLLFAYRAAPCVERSAHEIFQKYRIRGEWFRMEPLDVVFLDCALAHLTGSLKPDISSTAFDDLLQRAGTIYGGDPYELIANAASERGLPAVQ